MNDRPLLTGLYGVSGLLVLASFAWPSLFGQRDETRANALAEAGLQRVIEGERAAFAAQGRYVPFGPANVDRRSALPQLHLGPEFDDLSFDALLDPDGALQIRAMSRLDAVRVGRIPPVLKTATLAEHPKDPPNTGQ